MEGLTKAVRLAQLVMGTVYLIAGAIKVWEPVLFYWEVVPYTQLLGLGQESWERAAKGALVLGPVECGLGLALLLNWRPRWIFPLATVLMAFFLGLMVYAWRMGASVDCGCFGALVERSPGEAAVEDGVMLALLLFGWWGQRRLPISSWGKAPLAVAGGLALALVVGGMRFFPELERLEQSDLKEGVRLTGLAPQGVEVDLLKGKYLVELMSPVCGHCINAVPKMNYLATDPDLPRLIALTTFAQDSEQLEDFRKRLEPRFDIATISKTDFFRLTFGHGYPRLAYVKDGVVQAVWERDDMPSAEQLKEVTGS
jgi:hypothetical protein